MEVTETREAGRQPSTTMPWRIGLWLSALAMLLCLFVNGLASDIEFWRNWIWQFQLGGYQALNANYPPILLHWLRLLAWGFSAADFTPQGDLLIKMAVVLPVLLSQLVLVELVGRQLAGRGESPLRCATFWLTVFNPALLIDGPIWGQVDLLPFLPSYLAIVAATDRTRATWAFPWFAVALLCKFQAIVFAPLLAGLAIGHWRKHLFGAPVALLVIGMGFLPFALAGADVLEAMKRAYWGNVGLYPYASLNAANLWYLVTGKDQPDNISLLPPGTIPEGLAHLATPSKLGLLIFAVISLAIFVSAIRNSTRPHALGLAVIAALGFFAFSSGMHERYLFLAVPFAAIWACQAADRRFWYPLLTALVYLNINLMLDLTGYFIWRILSVLVILTFLLMVLQALAATRFADVIRVVAALAERLPRAPYAALTIAWLLLALGLVARQTDRASTVRPQVSAADKDSIFLGTLVPERYFQEWGELKIDVNLAGSRICIVRRCYDHGLATHARSAIAYRVPEGVTRFRADAGVERDGGGGEVSFSVEVDGDERWNSGAVTARDEAVPVDVPVAGGQMLTLKVDPLGVNYGDHAVWADAHFARQ